MPRPEWSERHDVATPLSATDQTLSSALAELARDLEREKTPDQVMAQIVEQAVQLVDGAEHASISVARGRREVHSAAVTDDVARGFDRLQQDVGQGPCLAAMVTERVVRSDEIASDSRWSALGVGAEALGVRSILCFQLFVSENSLGGLNLLSSHTKAFDDDAEVIGSTLAAHAAVALASVQKLDHLSTALVNRDLIGQAKGILMERFKLNADHAFELLARVSQDRNVKLHDVAEQLTRSGSLDR